jgi:hypothetical protein
MSPQPSPAASFLKRLLLLIIFGTASIFLIKAIYALGPAQSPDERKVKVRAFRDVPVELVEVRNLQSETWWKDLEIELKNVSKKPIYFLTAYLEFPDESIDGARHGISLAWGNPKKLDSRKLADADAEFVEPGKTFVLTIPKMYQGGLRVKQSLRPEATKNLTLGFEKIYFGDGTGFDAEGHWRDFRSSSSPPKPENRHHAIRLKERNHSTTCEK